MERMENDQDASLATAKVKAAIQRLRPQSTGGPDSRASGSRLEFLIMMPIMNPIFFVIGAARADESLLGTFMLLTWAGYLVNGLVFYFPGEIREQPLEGQAARTALIWQVVGLLPGLGLAPIWSSLSTGGMIAVYPALCVWMTVCLLFAFGQGAIPWERARTSDYRIMAMIAGGLWVFALFIVGLVLLVKAAHPLH